MNNTAYKRSIPSPFPQIRSMKHNPFNAPPQKHPVREELDKVLGQYSLTALIEEDTSTLSSMKHVNGLISFLCTLMMNGKVIAIGRGNSVLGPNNRYLTRTIQYAVNSAVVDSIMQATKIMGTFLGGSNVGIALDEAYKAKGMQESEPATDKQLNYLKQLIQINVSDEEERERWESQLHELTKDEASDAIASFRQ